MSDINLPKLNVFVGLYLISLVAIGTGEYYELCIIFYAGLISGVISLFVIIYTMPSYIRRYLKKEK